MSERKKEFLKLVDNDEKYIELIDNILYLEEQLKKLKELPHLRVNPDNPEQQKATPASKMYKEYMQQYINALKVILIAGTKQSTEEDSPLRQWIKNQSKEFPEVRNIL